MTIPDHSIGNVLPPFTGDDATTAARAPYRVALLDVVTRFGTSVRRREILRGLLRYRAVLRDVGFADALQWLDGSFIDKLPNREPGDIDVVTFFVPPASFATLTPDQEAMIAAKLDRATVKATFDCDSYFVEIDGNPLRLIQSTVYWYSLFSHQRDTFVWRGILEVTLTNDLTDDTEALNALDALDKEEGVGAAIAAPDVHEQDDG